MSTQKQRLDDFADRERADPAATVALEDDLGRYIAVHPMADETALLEELGIDASRCLKVDLYWHRKTDVWFVQIESERYAAHRPAGTYLRRGEGDYVNLVVVIPEDRVSSSIVTRELRAAAARPLELGSLGDRLTPV